MRSALSSAASLSWTVPPEIPSLARIARGGPMASNIRRMDSLPRETPLGVSKAGTRQGDRRKAITRTLVGKLKCLVRRLLEPALPPGDVGDDNPLDQAALAVENMHELSAEMAEEKLPRSIGGRSRKAFDASWNFEFLTGTPLAIDGPSRIEDSPHLPRRTRPVSACCRCGRASSGRAAARPRCRAARGRPGF